MKFKIVVRDTLNKKYKSSRKENQVLGGIFENLKPVGTMGATITK